MEVKDLLGCVGSATVLLLASAWIPILGPFISLLTPLPFLYYSSKLGFSQGIKLAALTAFIMVILDKVAGHPFSILFGIELSLLGLAISELFRRGLSLGQTISLGTLLMLLVGFGFLSIIAFSRGMGPLEMMDGYLRDHMRTALAVYEEMGVPPEKVHEFRAYGTRFLEIVSRIYPSLLIVGVGFTVWINVVFAKPLFHAGRVVYPDFIRMDHWRSPEGLVWGAIVSGFSSLVSSGALQGVSINVLIVIMTVYAFQGLSIVVFFLNKYRVPIWLRIGIYFLIIVQQLFLVILSLAGLFDQWVDFRKIHRKEVG